jgi:hypothetical protein
MAVCSYCKSTLLRDGETLRRIGHSAALFDDHSPLVLGAQGRLQGEAFTLIGRVQLAYRDEDGDEGRWTEWHALFDGGRSATLSEDNGAYVLTFALQPSADLPITALMSAPLGQTVFVDRRPWVLSSRVTVRVHAAEGELARKPDWQRPYPVVELRNTEGEVLSVEPQAQPPALDLGRSVQLADLHISLMDTRQPAEAQIKGKGLECPSCGAALAPTLDSTQSIVCGHCHAVVDISKGAGADLAFYRQDNALEPLIALGRTGRLKVDGRIDDWQVVGYQERCDLPQDPEDEQAFWREYLLYNQQLGFAFLVDAEDGWSVVRTVTGVPAMKGATLKYKGKTYQRRYTYPAKTTYVLGEFYWPVKREQRTQNADFVCEDAGVTRVLNREQTGSEITWSAGQTLSADEVMSAFQIPPGERRAFRRDAQMLTGIDWKKWVVVLFWVIVVLFIVALLARCSDECSGVRDTYGEYSAEYRSCRAYYGSSGSSGHGGSYGGYSSGGSHK